MNSPAKLTDTQFAILSEASQRKDRCLIPPKTLKAAAAQRVATKLLKAGLVREIKAKTGMEAWRRDDETGQAYSLKLTDAGLKAIAADERGSQSIPSTAVPPDRRHWVVAPYRASRADRPSPSRLRRPPGAWRNRAAPQSTAPSRLSRPARDPNATEPEELDAAADQFVRRAAWIYPIDLFGVCEPSAAARCD